MNHKNYDLIAFDWDGTLFDSTASIAKAIQAAVHDVGGKLPTQKTALYVIGLGLEQALAAAAPDVPKHKHPDLVQSYRKCYAQEQHNMQLFAGSLDLLNRLKKRQYRLAVATGKSRKGLNECLQNPALQNIFCASKTADETAGKPDPLMLHELIEEMGTTPERSLMIGDTTHDLQMARNAGCAYVAVAWGAHSKAELQALRPLYLAESMTQLQDWLEHHG